MAFLANRTGPGVAQLRNAIARVRPQTCISLRGVTTKPGFTGALLRRHSMSDSILYDAPLAGKKSDPDYAPALNVRKGYLTNNATSLIAVQPDHKQLPPCRCSGYSAPRPWRSRRIGAEADFVPI